MRCSKSLVLLLALGGCGEDALRSQDSSAQLGDGGADAALDLAPADAAPDTAIDAPLDVARGGAIDAPLDASRDAAITIATVDAGAAGDAAVDLGPCQGGYLNSADPAACPLSCSPLVAPVPEEGRMHVAFGSPVVYQHNPPASGSHWPWPAPWGPHTTVVPREWWVHNLEHGGIVLLYNCPWPGDGGAGDGGAGDGGAPVPDDCPTEIAALTALWAQHPEENWFDMVFEVRILVTADPLLPARFAAVAWDWSYLSDSFDGAAFSCFIKARYGRGPENIP